MDKDITKRLFMRILEGSIIWYKQCTIVTALLRAFHPCIAHPREISSTPGSRSDVYKCTNSQERTQTSD